MKKMKNTMYTLLIAIAVIFTATSCSKDDDGGSGGNAAAGTIKAKVAGSNFSSNPQLSAATQINAGGSTTITVQGNDNSGKGIVLVMNGVDGTGSYNIGGGANISISASYIEVDASNPTAAQTWQAPFDSSVAGEINISEFTASKVVGTFEFTGKNVNGDNSTKEITEGSFNMDF
ncbi:DUF6252 family protein [Planktosalinus lacus]|uniref:Lipoprotein n=1 Tax=Planktosalinus lacus TaxID=1526573 RepID=A0A8J2V877_9FLAO|nr:DUF6252 family protein [Planktosalinus lacus]GGD86560.1 hypothetical protein GCM10011312_08270 [Planktosalinus lacus]